MANATVCPPDEQLQSLLLGELIGPDAQALESHFAHCDRCLRIARRMRAQDGLLGALRSRRDVGTRFDADLESGLVERLCELRPSTSAERSTHDAASDQSAAPEELGEIEAIGPYRILKLLGSGGMGAVYQARQTRPDRLVALKLIPAGARATRDRLARFRAEAELIARLQHPNIVPVYDAGEHDGQPYFTMEYVDGGSLADQLAAAPLAPRPAAVLIEKLARAVHHAHERGVVHRDLKPSNILLARSDPFRGILAVSHRDESRHYEPKIADFGLAKQLLNETQALPASGRTETGVLLGTPNYMAPEQATGQPQTVGPAADIYALGAILYECVTGRPPFRAATVLETLDQVRTQEPVPPGRLQPGLPPDLQTICLKCLAKEATRRYASAGELADDLTRFLAGEPIQARPVGIWERIRKWARRKPAAATLLAVTTLFATTAVVGVLVHSAQLRTAAIEARLQQERAETQYREARDTLRQMLARASARSGEGIPKLQELRREQQEDALAFFLKMAEQHGDDPEVRFEVAQARHQAGLLQSTLGRLEEATQNLRRAEQQFAALAAEFPDRPQYRMHHADTLKVLGGVGNLSPAEADDCLRRALARTVELVREQPGSVEFRSADADVRITLGGILYHKGDKSEAEEHYRRAAAVYEELSRKQPENSNHRLVLARAYLNISLVMQGTKRHPHEFHDKADATLEQLYRENPNDDEVVTTLAQLRINGAYVLDSEGMADAAVAEVTKNVAMLEESLRREPNHAALRDRLYRSYGVRASFLQVQGRFAESVDDWRRTIELSPSPQQADLHRLQMAKNCALAGQHSVAVGVIEDWNTRSTPDTPADHLRHCASVYGLALKAVRADDSLSAQSQDELVNHYVARAIEFLRRTKSVLGADKWGQAVAEIHNDKYFKPLLEHAEFQRWMTEKERPPRGP